MTRVACLMMQKDERLLLLPWLLYHGYLFGYENLFVYDNDSAPGPVQETLAQFEALGVNIDRDHCTLADFAAKGERLGDRVAQFRQDDRYDIALFLDCDEFIAIETEAGFSCGRNAIMAELDRLAAAGAFARIDHCLLNAPGYFDLFNHAWNQKCVVPVRHFTHIDHGFQQPVLPPGQEFALTSLLHIHMRSRPFHQMQAQALLKLAAFTDVTNPAALLAYEGSGKHLVQAVLARPATYYQITDALGPLVRFDGLGQFLRQFAGFETRRRIWEAGQQETQPEPEHAASHTASHTASQAAAPQPAGGFNAVDDAGGYLKFLDCLTAKDFAEVRVAPGQRAVKQDIKLQIEAEYEFIDLLNAGHHPALAALGISGDFLKLARRGHRAISEFFIQWAAQRFGAPFTQAHLSGGVGDALAVIKSGEKHALSPFTCSFAPTRDSLGPHWFRVTEGGNAFLAGQLQPVAIKAQDCIWVLPGLRKILFIRTDPHLNQEVVLENLGRMMTRVINRFDDAAAYLQSDSRKTIIYERQCPQFGHYVWNVLSAWGQLFELVDAAEIGMMLTNNSNRFFGSMSEVFGLAGAREIHFDTEQELFDLSLNENGLLSFVQFDHITAGTGASVVRHAMRHCDPAFRDRLAALSVRAWPIVLFSLRLDNRAWEDQVAGFIELAADVKRDFPDAGFVIHGLSKDVPMGWTTSWMSLEAEMAAAESIEAGIADFAPILNAVGLAMHESVAISQACDVFAAPIGSGMALYKWITNKPGVAFSNRHCLDAAGPWAYQVFDHCRDGVIPAIKLPLTAVTDLESTHHGVVARANFTLDRAVLYDCLKQLIQSLPRRTYIAAAAAE